MPRLELATEPYRIDIEEESVASAMLPTDWRWAKLPRGHRLAMALLHHAGPAYERALAEVCAGLCLAGELSIIGAMCAGNFGRAHRLLARGRTRKTASDGKSR